MPPPLHSAWLRSRGVRLATLLAPALACLALLGLAELTLRLTLRPLESLEVFVRSPLQQDDFEDGRHVRIFEGDPLLFWRLKPGLEDVIWDYTVVTTNAQGLRQPRPLGPKPAGGVRIVCLGDSVTFGYRVPQVFAEHPESYDHQAAPYPQLLERRLLASNPGREIEVLNLGVPGYTSRQGRAWLARDRATLAPDIVTIAFGWNDVAGREGPDRDTLPMDRPSVMARAVASHSQVLLRAAQGVRVLVQRFRRARPGGVVADTPRVSVDEHVGNVLAAAELAGERGARVVVLAQVFGGQATPTLESVRMSAYRDALRAAARDARLPFCEIRELTEAAFPGNAALFPVEPIHPGERGQDLLAAALLRCLADQGILAAYGLGPVPSATSR